MKKLYLSIPMLVFLCSAVYAQTNTKDVQTQNNVIDTSFTGTYQIQLINTRDQPYIPGNLKELVLNNRHATKQVTISLGDLVRLVILSEAEIKAAGFKPLKQIAYVTE